MIRIGPLPSATAKQPRVKPKSPATSRAWPRLRNEPVANPRPTEIPVAETLSNGAKLGWR